jgi:hypothetical protein
LRKTPKPEDLFPLSFDPEETFQIKVDKAVVTPLKSFQKLRSERAHRKIK